MEAHFENHLGGWGTQKRMQTKALTVSTCMKQLHWRGWKKMCQPKKLWK